MYHIALHSRMQQIIELFLYLGIWEYEETVPEKGKLAKKYFYFIFYFSFLISVLTGAFYNDDRNESIFLAAVAMALVVFLMKLKYILFEQKDMYMFIQNIGTHSLTDEKECLRINRKLNILMNFATAVISSTFLGITPLYVLAPVLSAERKLPMSIGLPFNWRNSEIGYWSAYVYMWCNLMCTIFCMLLNVIIWYLMMNCAIKYESLGNQFKCVGAIKTARTGVQDRKLPEAKTQTSFLRELIDLINTHRELQKTIDGFASRFKNLFFTQITNSGIIICGSLYAMAFTEDLIPRITYFSAVMYNIFDIFMVMYFGNEIKLSSDRLSYCLFESDWTEQTKSCQKSIIILSEILKQPQELIIYKLYPLNLETFTSILNVTYRMFNILISLK